MVKKEEQDPNLKERVRVEEEEVVSSAEIGEATVWMVHSDFPDRDPVEVAARVFKGTWEELGWVKTDAPAPRVRAQRGAESESELSPELASDLGEEVPPESAED